MTSGVGWWDRDREGGDLLLLTVFRLFSPSPRGTNYRHILPSVRETGDQQGGGRCGKEAATAVKGPYPRKRSGLPMSVSELERPGMQRPRFDWTVNLGHVLTIAALLGTLGTMYTTYQVTVSDHDSRLRTLEKQILFLDTRANDSTNVLYSIKQDLAIIKYRMEQEEKRK